MNIKTSFRKPTKESFRNGTWRVQADKNWATLKAQDARAKQTGTLVGRYLTEPVADGRAVYVVVAESRETATIKIVSGISDYAHSYFGAGRVIDRSYVEKRIQGRDDMEQWMASKRTLKETAA